MQYAITSRLSPLVLPPLMFKLKHIQIDLENKLKKAGIEEHTQESRFILQHVTGFDYLQLKMDPFALIGSELISEIDEIYQRRLKREPLQYILESQAFLQFDLKVVSGVLIPRPETEQLVELVLSNLPTNEPWLIAEMGCGSGAISVSLAVHRQNSSIFCSDISEKALNTTQFNAERYNVKDRIHLWLGDGLEPFISMKKKFHLFVSNPPYIALSDWHDLEPEVKAYEPQLALTPGEDPLKFYRDFAEKLPLILRANAPIFLELDSRYARDVQELFDSSDHYHSSVLIQDLQGHYRFLEAYFNG